VLKSLIARARARPAKKRTWRRALSAIVLALSLAFLGYKAWRSWDALKTYELHIRYVRLLPSFALFLAQLMVITWGWQSIMNAIASPLPFQSHLKVYGYTNLMRRIPAGVVWMVAGRAYGYKDEGIPARTSVVASLIELITVVLSGLPLAALAGWGLGFLPPAAGWSIALALLATECAALHPAVLAKLLQLAHRGSETRVEDSDHEPPWNRLTYRRTLTWAAVYTLVWLISGIGLFLVGGLFAELPTSHLPAMVGVWVMSSLASYLTLFSPSGLGVKELSAALLLGTFLPDPLPLLIVLALRLIWTAYDVVIGVAVLLL
jgi:hypothetical protein